MFLLSKLISYLLNRLLSVDDVNKRHTIPQYHLVNIKSMLKLS